MTNFDMKACNDNEIDINNRKHDWAEVRHPWKFVYKGLPYVYRLTIHRFA